MNSHAEPAQKIAQYLLQIKAIKLQPTTPFTWASGWKSPIYCDNRKTLSFPQIRDSIKMEMVNAIKNNYNKPDVIAGVATGGIALGVLVAQELNLPFVYVRSEAKAHGLSNRIEGVIEAEQKVVVIEDLISTGKSSLMAVDALREAGCEVIGMVAIFTYGFKSAEDNFTLKNCKYVALSNYEALVDEALNAGYISEKDLDSLKEWRKTPEKWGVEVSN
jgi:orotate phosphoribosyltransferase